MRCASIIVLLYLCKYVFCWGDVVMYPHPMEMKMIPAERSIPLMYNQRMPPYRNMQIRPQQQLTPVRHSNAQSSRIVSKPQIPEEDQTKGFNYTELINSFRNIGQENEDEQETSRGVESQYQQYSPFINQQTQPPPYNYMGPSAYNSIPIQEGYGPLAPVHHPTKMFPKADISDLVKPVASKVAGKISGVIGLVLALLTGSSPHDAELKGFKDIVINGIVKPLLSAQGGIKALFSKITIPLLALFLINLEVLVTMWWLWDDCPQHSPAPYAYQSQPVHNGYNTYNPYR